MRKFLLSLIIFMSCIFLPDDIYANEENVYNIEFISWEFRISSKPTHASGYHVKGTLTTTYKMVAYRSASKDIVNFIVFSSNEMEDCGSFLSNLSNYVEWSGTYESGRLLFSTGEFDLEKYADYYKTSTGLGGRTYWNGFDYMNDDNPGFLNTNIPVFSSKEEAEKYIAGELTEKDALNYESELCKIVYDLEVPQNLKVEFDLVGIFRDPEYRFNWEQTDQNYTKWDTEIYVYGDFYGYDSVLGIPIGDDYVFEEEYIYKETIDTYKLRYVIAPETYIYEKGYDAVIERLLELEMNGTFSVEAYHVYIRNAYFDGDEQHYSNWVYVSFDHDFSGVNDLVVIEVEGSVEDTPGNVGTGTGTGINGNINNDSQYDGSVDVNWDESNDDIFTWISNGFGLGGDNGVITLLSDTFSFIPSELWAVFMSGIALMVLISVVKWVRG